MNTVTSPAISTEEKTNSRALILLIIGACFIGLSPIFIRFGNLNSGLGFATIGFWRMLLAVPFFWVMMQKERKKENRTPIILHEYGLIFICGGLFALELTLWHAALAWTSVANATLMNNLSPLFVVLVSWVFLKKTVSRAFVSGLFIAIAGAGLLAINHYEISSTSWIGDTIALFSALFYGLYIILLTSLRKKIPTATLMFWSCVSMVIVLFFAAIIRGEMLILQTPEDWMAVIGLAIFSQILGQGLITYGMAWLPAPLSALILLLQPVVATALAWILFNEALSLSAIIGGMLILFGLYYARRKNT